MGLRLTVPRQQFLYDAVALPRDYPIPLIDDSALFVTGVEQFGQGPRLPPAQKSDQHVGARSRCDIAELDLAGADSLLDHDKTTAVHRDGSRGYFKRQRSWAGSAHGIHLDGQCGGYLA